MTTQKISISNTTIFKIALLIIGLIFMYLIRDILLMVFVAFIIAATLHGPVSWLERRKIPRVLGTIFVYLVLLFILILIVYLILPPLIDEIKNLAVSFPDYVEKIGGGLQHWINKYQLQNQIQELLTRANQHLTGYATGIFATTVSVFGGLISAFVVLVISFYLTLQAKEVKKFLVAWAPIKRQDYFSGLVNRLQIKMGNWLLGQLFLMVVIGILTFIGLSVLKVKYALVLALIAGLFEIIPWLGPWLAAIVAVFLVFLQSPFLALLVIILYFVIQQLENNLIVPQIMKRAVGLNPVMVIVALLIGGKLAGILGIVLAVPVAAILAELGRDFQERRK